MATTLLTALSGPLSVFSVLIFVCLAGGALALFAWVKEETGSTHWAFVAASLPALLINGYVLLAAWVVWAVTHGLLYLEHVAGRKHAVRAPTPASIPEWRDIRADLAGSKHLRATPRMEVFRPWRAYADAVAQAERTEAVNRDLVVALSRTRQGLAAAERELSAACAETRSCATRLENEVGDLHQKLSISERARAGLEGALGRHEQERERMTTELADVRGALADAEKRLASLDVLVGTLTEHDDLFRAEDLDAVTEWLRALPGAESVRVAEPSRAIDWASEWSLDDEVDPPADEDDVPLVRRIVDAATLAEIEVRFESPEMAAANTVAVHIASIVALRNAERDAQRSGPGTDPLTRLPAETSFVRDWSLASRAGLPLPDAVLVLRLGGVEKFREAFGEVAWEALNCQLAERVAAATASMDARWYRVADGVLALAGSAAALAASVPCVKHAAAEAVGADCGVACLVRRIGADEGPWNVVAGARAIVTGESAQEAGQCTHDSAGAASGRS